MQETPHGCPVQSIDVASVFSWGTTIQEVQASTVLPFTVVSQLLEI